MTLPQGVLIEEKTRDLICCRLEGYSEQRLSICRQSYCLRLTDSLQMLRYRRGLTWRAEEAQVRGRRGLRVSE